MNKVYADWYLVREAENKGLSVSMDGCLERNRTELNNRLSAYYREKMPNFDPTYKEEYCEDVLYCINEYIEEKGINKRELDFPISEGTDIHLLKITDNLQVKITIADEYYGGGDYSKYIEIDRFVITPEATEEDVDILIDFVKSIKY